MQSLSAVQLSIWLLQLSACRQRSPVITSSEVRDRPLHVITDRLTVNAGTFRAAARHFVAREALPARGYGPRKGKWTLCSSHRGGGACYRPLHAYAYQPVPTPPIPSHHPSRRAGISHKC